MARIRSIKPDFFMDEETATLPPDAQLLLIGLWTLADRDGRLEDKVRRIKAQVFPYREVDVEATLGVLEVSGVIQRYTAGEEACIQIVRFLRDQRPHPKETSYGLPGPETASREVSRQGVDASRRVPLVVGCGSGSGSGSLAGSTDASPQAPLFDESPKTPAKPKRPKPEPTGDPRHKPLMDAMAGAYGEVLAGQKWDLAGGMGGREAKAVKELLAKADADPRTAGDMAVPEVVRRWRHAIGDPFTRTRYAHLLVDRWGQYDTPRQQGSATPNARAPVRAESQPQYDPSKPPVTVLSGRDAFKEFMP